MKRREFLGQEKHVRKSWVKRACPVRVTHTKIIRVVGVQRMRKDAIEVGEVN